MGWAQLCVVYMLRFVKSDKTSVCHNVAFVDVLVVFDVVIEFNFMVVLLLLFRFLILFIFFSSLTRPTHIHIFRKSFSVGCSFNWYILPSSVFRFFVFFQQQIQVTVSFVFYYYHIMPSPLCVTY